MSGAVYHVSVWEQHIVMPHGIRHMLNPRGFYAIWETAIHWKELKLMPIYQHIENTLFPVTQICHAQKLQPTHMSKLVVLCKHLHT